MATRSRRYRSAQTKRDDRAPAGAPVALGDAVKLLKELDAPRFDETVDLVLKLGIDPRQSTQNVRGSFSLPNGIGKTVRVIAFAEGDDAEAARGAGAVEVGAADLVKKIQDGWLDFDVAIAHPRMMRFVGRLGKILGPQGKMPSPKSGTVTEDVATGVREFCAGKVEFRNDKGGNVHVPVGKRSFPEEKLVENISALIDHVQGLRPSGAKGAFIQRATVSTTMGPGIPLVL
jgi:large subunit ribosomal protein L1